MNNSTTGAEFGAMTLDELQDVNGGESAFASMVGFFVAYTAECVRQAMIVNIAVYNRQAFTYVDGAGFIS